MNNGGGKQGNGRSITKLLVYLKLLFFLHNPKYLVVNTKSKRGKAQL